MKKLFVLFVAALAITVCNPVMGQTRKDKKEAQKKEWEAQQQRRAEEEAGPPAQVLPVWPESGWLEQVFLYQRRV